MDKFHHPTNEGIDIICAQEEVQARGVVILYWLLASSRLSPLWPPDARSSGCVATPNAADFALSRYGNDRRCLSWRPVPAAGSDLGCRNVKIWTIDVLLTRSKISLGKSDCSAETFTVIRSEW